MAKNTETTTKFKVDISELKQGLRDANRAIELTNSEFKKSVAGMDDWRKSADGLSAKITQLKNVNSNYKTILKDVSKKYDDVVASEGENSESAQRLKIKMNQLQAAIKGNENAIGKYEKSLDDVGKESKQAKKSLDDVADEIKDTGDEAEKSSGKLKGFLGALGKGVIGGIGAAVGGLAAGLTAAVESSKEFNDNMSKLETVADSGGYSAEYAKDSFADLYGILGDETAANTTVSNFMAMETSTENLNSLLNSSAGIWAKYGDSIPLDGLAESVNETAKVGTVTGTLADALNWAGVNEDAFNESLAACTSEQERQQLIVNTLDGLYGDLGEKYKENNKAVIDLNKAQLRMKDSIAKIGTAFTPILAMFTQFGAGLLSSIVPDIESMATAFTDLTNGVEGAEDKIGTAISNILNTLITTIVDMLPQITSIGISIITGLASGIMENSGEILTAAEEIIMTIGDALITLAPTLLTGLIDLLMQLATAIIEFAPDILNAGIELLSGLVDALMEIDIGTELTNLIDTICTTITTSLPDLIEAAVEFFMGLVDAIPTVIDNLLVALPDIINMITETLITAIPQLSEAAITMFNALVDAIPGIIESLVANLPSIIEAIVNLIAQAVPRLLEAAINMFMALVQAIPKILPALAEALPQIITAVWEGLKSLPGKIMEVFSEVFPKFTQWCKDMITKINEKVPEIVDSIITWIKELPGKIWNWLCDVVDNVVDWGNDMITEANDAMTDFFNDIIEWICQLPAEIWNWLVDVVNNVIDWGADMISEASSAMSDFFDGIIDTISGLPEEIWNWLCNVVDKVVDWGADLLSTATTAASDMFDGIVETISGLPEEMLSIGSNIVSGLWDGISGAWDWLWEKLEGFLDDIWTGITDFFDINSPSGLMRDGVGKFLPMGIGEGITQNARYAVDAMKSLGNDMMKPAQNIKNNLVKSATPSKTLGGSVVNNYTFNQTNNSPKSLSRYEIYRQSKNLLNVGRA